MAKQLISRTLTLAIVNYSLVDVRDGQAELVPQPARHFSSDTTKEKARRILAKELGPDIPFAITSIGQSSARYEMDFDTFVRHATRYAVDASEAESADDDDEQPVPASNPSPDPVTEFEVGGMAPPAAGGGEHGAAHEVPGSTDGPASPFGVHSSTPGDTPNIEAMPETAPPDDDACYGCTECDCSECNFEDCE